MRRLLDVSPPGRLIQTWTLMLTRRAVRLGAAVSRRGVPSNLDIRGSLQLRSNDMCGLLGSRRRVLTVMWNGGGHFSKTS
jgi:hypothetical protein